MFFSLYIKKNETVNKHCKNAFLDAELIKKNYRHSFFISFVSWEKKIMPIPICTIMKLNTKKMSHLKSLEHIVD